MNINVAVKLNDCRNFSLYAFGIFTGAEKYFDPVQLAVHVEEALGGGNVDSNPGRVLLRGDALDGERLGTMAASEGDGIALLRVQT